MQESVLRPLTARRPEIRARWEALLRIERVNTPLANPDTLIYLFDWTLDQIFAALRGFSAMPAEMTAPICTSCECGRNPFIAYFIAGRQALNEALVLVQAEARDPDPAARDAAVAELRAIVDRLSQREVSSFCSVCQHRTTPLASSVANVGGAH